MKSIFKFFDNAKVHKAIKIALILLIFIYVFAVSSFGEQRFKKIPLFNYGIYIVYVSMALLFAMTVLSIFVFKIKLKVNRFALLIPAFVIYALVGTAIYSKDFRVQTPMYRRTQANCHPSP